jgi:hypothetical protein
MSAFDEAIPELDRAGLRRFGLVLAGMFAGVFGLALPWLFAYGMPWWPWLLALVLATWSLLAPDSLRAPYHVWMRFGLAIGRVMSVLVLGVVYLAIVAPLGLLMRVFGRDPMLRRLDRSCETYRQASQDRKPNHLENPF